MQNLIMIALALLFTACEQSGSSSSSSSSKDLQVVTRDVTADYYGTYTSACLTAATQYGESSQYEVEISAEGSTLRAYDYQSPNCGINFMTIRSYRLDSHVERSVVEGKVKIRLFVEYLDGVIEPKHVAVANDLNASGCTSGASLGAESDLVGECQSNKEGKQEKYLVRDVAGGHRLVPTGDTEITEAFNLIKQ